jgi:predicted lipoprotein
MRHALVLVLLTAFWACKIATVRPIATDGSPGPEARAFDAAAHVEKIWGTEVVPTVEREATECTQLLASLQKDREGTLQRLGRGPRASHLLAKGEGKVVSVDRRSRAGLLGVDVAPVDGQADVWVQIGPVLQGMALRDAVGFISFGQFVNQLDYADVGNALNQRVLDSVLRGLDAESAKGRAVSFAGALTPGERLLVTPVRLTVKEG